MLACMRGDTDRRADGRRVANLHMLPGGMRVVLYVCYPRFAEQHQLGLQAGPRPPDRQIDRMGIISIV